MEAISVDDPALKGQEDYGSDSGSVSSCSIASGGGPPPLASASGGSRWGGAAAGGGGGTTAREDTIQVSVRLRPLNAKELARNDPFDWECINDTTIMFRNSLPERSMFPTTYSFDRVFRYDSTTKQVYEDGAKYVALSVVSGINASIFAYGQTSSGKTYTMTGITEYAMTDIYHYIQRHKEREFVLKFSAMEIYNEAVKDLLSADTTPLRLLDDHDRGTTVEKLTEETLRDWDHLKELLTICEAQRQIGETSLNETSSRSHQILRLSVESSAHEFLGRDNSSSLAATVNFVDLAGSERASQAMSAGTRLKEGCHINRSLLTLGTVIRKLSKGRTGHVPYRDSKLTRILQHSLGGNARTAIICTMSPARSHVEQSRNTLLFASCAKEVATCAQVNVVMSDKALVKHLQKELTRLENELRSLGLNSNNSYADTLLKEKDAQIQKMEMEILELTHQRDLAQSRIEDLMRAMRDDEERELEDGLVQPAPTSYVLSICEEKLSSLYDPPSVPDFEFTETDHVLSHKLYNDDDASCNGGNYQVVMEKPNEHDATSTEESIGSPYLDGSAVNYRDEEIMSVDDCQDTKVDLCKEVRCIEIDESSTSRNGRIHCLLTDESDALLPSITYVNDFDGQLETVTKLRGESDRDVRKIIEHFLKPFPHGPLPWPSMKLLSNSKSLCLAKSRSCKGSLMNKSTNSAWFLEEENEKIILNCFMEASQPDGFQKDIFSAICNAENGGAPLEYGLQMSRTPSIDVLKPDKDCNIAEEEAPWEYGRQMSGKPSIDVLKPKTVKIEPEEDVANICTFAAESKEEKAKTQILEQPKDSQVVDQKDIVDSKIEKSDVQKSLDKTCPDVTENPKELSQHSSAEFERQQRDLVALWHVCNVSLVHRTYFFLLFKGDPADSIYMEVERRRLSCLRRVFFQGGSDKPLVVGIGDHITLASSMKALRRERRMLCRQMQKRLSAEERENLYRKWGVPLDSKKRKTQLISKLWSDTRNMDQIKESASVVATLIGLLEPDEALKEMFPMSFAPQMLIKGRSSGTSLY